jgi:hypothetical protein
VLAAERSDLAERIDGTGADRACSPDHDEREIAGRLIFREARGERRNVHPQAVVGRDPADARGTDAGEVGGLLNPGVSLCRSVAAKRRPRSVVDAVRANIPIRTRSARGQEADEVGHVAAAHQQPPAIGGIANQFRDPPDRLALDLGRSRSQQPAADVRIERGREQIAEHADRRRR